MWNILVMKQLDCSCIFSTDFWNFTGTRIDFTAKALIFDNLVDIPLSQAFLPDPNWDNSSLDEGQPTKLLELLHSFRNLFSEESVLTHVVSHSIDMNDAYPVKCRPYRYDGVKLNILEYHSRKTLKLDIIEPCDSLYASPIISCE